MKLKKLWIVTLLFPAIVFISCGKKKDEEQAVVNTAPVNTCTYGQVWQSGYGCMPMAQQNPGWGIPPNYNQPVSAGCWGGTFLTQYGCLPQGRCASGLAELTTGGYAGFYCVNVVQNSASFSWSYYRRWGVFY